MHDDADYVAGAKAGSEAAWRHLVAAHQERLVRLAWALTGDRERAMEIAQETFVEAFVRIGQLRDNRAFGAWLRTIAVRAARRTYRRPPPMPSVEPAHARTPPRELIAKELRAAVDQAIASLEPIYREALAIAMEGGLTSAEAGSLLGCSAEAYRVRLHKARRTVRERLSEFLTE